MSILRKSIDSILLSDLEALVEARARETDELEFKGDLPFQATRGNPSTSDRWHEVGDRIGDYARDKILAETVAFANANGGTLILGLEETRTTPRRAEALAPLPRCEDLAKRLLDAAEDLIEPRLPLISARAIAAPDGDDGAGYIILRAGKSAIGPHRLNSTSGREFYIRRGERATKMTVREIREHTLETARSGDKLEEAFVARQAQGVKAFAAAHIPSADPVPPVHVRVTAIPTSAQAIDNLTHRPDLWWTGRPFSVTIDRDKSYYCGGSADEFYHSPTPRLRSLVIENSTVNRLLRADGAVEFYLSHPAGQPYRGTHATLFWSWIIGLVAGTIGQIERLRQRLAWDSVEYGLEVEIRTAGLVRVYWEQGLHDTGILLTNIPLLLPRYSISSRDDLDDVVTSIVRDIVNASGHPFSSRIAVPWEGIFGEE